MPPARVRLVVARNRWVWWVLGPFAAGLGLLGWRFGEAFPAAIGVWMLLVGAVLNWPPRYMGSRGPGGVTLRAGLDRRLVTLAMIGPAVFLWPFVAFRAAGAESLVPWGVTGAVAVVFLVTAWGTRARFVLGPAGIEHVRPWPAGARFISWERIAEVRTWSWRGARGIVVESGDLRLHVPELVDGIGDLAVLLLERAPPDALWRNPRARERLEQLAQR